MYTLIIIGCGSIGRRHAKVFSDLGVKNIFAVDINQERLEIIEKECNIKKTFTDFNDALNEKIDCAIIATPPHLHCEIALKCANAKMHLFIEKPISVEKKGLDELEQICFQNNLTCYVSYCYRYIPSVVKLKKYIDMNKIGKVLSYRLWISSYLPDWHPWEDYRSYYMAFKEQGGGALYDESHGIDLVRWFFGEIKSVQSNIGNVSDLEISSDDIALLISEHENGIKGSSHFDLLGRIPQIGMEIIGTNGTIIWDRINPSIKIYDIEKKKWTKEFFEADDTISSYKYQAQAFINNIENGTELKNNLDSGRKTLEVILASVASNKEGSRKLINKI